MDLELQFWRGIGRCVPPLPHATGIINRLIKPLYLRKPRPPTTATAWGRRMRLDPAESIDGMILLCPQLYNRIEFQWLRQHLRPTDTFVDVGAHIGAYSLYASKFSQRVVAVEANPTTFSILEENIRLNGSQIEALNVGASDAHEVLRLHVQGGRNRGGSSFVIEHGKGDIDVPCRPLLDIAPEADAIKLDVELMEHRVLAPYLPHRKPRLIILEKHGSEDAIHLCRSFGYRVVATTSENALLM